MVMQKILFAGDTPAQIAFGIDGLSWGEKQVNTLLHGGVAGILPLHLLASEHSRI
jgi:hypothetical protein